MTGMKIPPAFIPEPYQRVGVEPALPEAPIDIEPEPVTAVVVVEQPTPAPAPTPPRPAVKPMENRDRWRLRAVGAQRVEGWKDLPETEKQELIQRMWEAGQ